MNKKGTGIQAIGFILFLVGFLSLIGSLIRCLKRGKDTLYDINYTTQCLFQTPITWLCIGISILLLLIGIGLLKD